MDWFARACGSGRGFAPASARRGISFLMGERRRGSDGRGGESGRRGAAALGRVLPALLPWGVRGGGSRSPRGAARPRGSPGQGGSACFSRNRRRKSRAAERPRGRGLGCGFVT
ncbi:uncharacterized protein LOC125024809 [Penaeus chinensis]|uniref:uncharacterized protein LOC125024809 n=1 Tax=Penaeus chinensis TaxID=139456 RepID=UPI001FB813F2|nr:uncharacterized protein LOC125024809 [Penaeus chinensis]